jgi:endonuclease YncB( thermonuclease family)
MRHKARKSAQSTFAHLTVALDPHERNRPFDCQRVPWQGCIATMQMRMLNKCGIAWLYECYAPNSPLYGALTEAKVAKRGLWQDADAIPPRERRRLKK